MPECITFKPVHSAEYPYSVGIRFDRNSPVHEHIDHYNRLAAWCEEHLEPGSWTIAIFTHGIHFKTEADLLMFKLRWCQHARFSRKYPYHVNVPLTENWSKRYDWCVATFGNFDNWMYGATCFYFKHEKDAVLYSLRWL